MRGCGKSECAGLGRSLDLGSLQEGQRARARLCTAPLRRTEENPCKTESRGRAECLSPHLIPVCASPDAWRATWRSCRLFFALLLHHLLLFFFLVLLPLIIIRESDNGYWLLPRCDHGLLRKRGVEEVAGCSGYAVSRIRGEVRWALGLDAVISHIYRASDYSINQAARGFKSTSCAWSDVWGSGVAAEDVSVYLRPFSLPLSLSFLVIIILIDYFFGFLFLPPCTI